MKGKRKLVSLLVALMVVMTFTCSLSGFTESGQTDNASATSAATEVTETQNEATADTAQPAEGQTVQTDESKDSTQVTNETPAVEDNTSSSEDKKTESTANTAGAVRVQLAKPARAGKLNETNNVPTHHKTLTKKGEDLYTLTLDITGLRTVGEKPKVDVLLIVDKSGSMNESMGSSTRMNVLKNVVTGNGGLTDTLLGTTAQEKIDARMAVVSYSGEKYKYYNPENDTPYNDASTVVSWTNVKKDVNDAFTLITAEGGTNCEAGLREGARTLTSARDDAAKYVIFLTDGMPTNFYASGNDYGYNSGYDYHKFTAGVSLGDGKADKPGINGSYYYIYDNSKGKLLSDGCLNCTHRNGH